MFLSVAHAEVARPQSSSKLLRERGLHGYILLPHVSPGRGGVDMGSSSQCCRLHGTFFFDEQRGVGKAGGFTVSVSICWLHRIQVCDRLKGLSGFHREFSFFKGP